VGGRMISTPRLSTAPGEEITHFGPEPTWREHARQTRENHIECNEFSAPACVGWSRNAVKTTPRIGLDQAGKMQHPGNVLPHHLTTTQSLFGTLSSSGTSQKLAYLSDKVPGVAPRFSTHDCKAMSSSAYSNYRHTGQIISTQVDMSLPKLSETKERYSDPTGQTDPNSFGTRSEFFSKGGLALCSGTSRIKDGTGMDYKSWA